MVWHFFESHKGKSSSDSIGAIAKCALQQGMMKRELGVDQVGQVILVMESEVEHSKFEHFYVEALTNLVAKQQIARTRVL